MNLGKIAKGILGTVAPLLGAALPGPVGPMAVSILKSVFGTDDESEIEKQLAAGNPEALVKLRTAEADLKVRMGELGIKEQDLHVKNTEGARKLAMNTSVWFQFILTITAMFAFGFVLYILVIQSQIIPPENKDIVIFLVGQLSGFVMIGYNFFLGSSKGSKESKEMAMKLGGKE